MLKIDLETPISQLTRVGQTTARRLKKLGLESCRDLLFYFPTRYDDFSNILPIAKLFPDTLATIKGKIELIGNKRSWKKRMIITEALVSDKKSSIKAIWFNQPFLTKILKPGEQIYLSGKVDYDYHQLQFVNPSYEKIKKEQTHTARIVPIYSLTEGLTQKQIRFLIKLILPLVKEINDWLPWAIKKNANLTDLRTALRQIHFPVHKNTLNKAKERLKFDELFLIQLNTLKLKQNLEQAQAYSIQFKQKETKDLVNSLPFQLTTAQRKTAWEILRNLHKARPMNRLLEGDVGSGKTVVAAIAILNVILNGFQVAYMAPTEILAKQHFDTLTKIFKKFKLKIGLLTRTYSQTNSRQKIKKARFARKARQANLLKSIKEEKINLILGTHALIQEGIEFKNLALIIIDEQHRFGVEQRRSLKDKAERIPHLLSMTATPIPRSLALTLYGDLDLSIINQMPKDRKTVITKIVPLEKRTKAYAFINQEIKKGRQVFVICPLIEESDKLGVKAVTSEYQKLSKEVFPHLKIGMLHGKLKPREKEEIMKKFQANKINILVSTSVVEVGIDIPNATIMMIEGAERFGLAQIHQFRGRVGRAQYQSYCFLFTESDSFNTQKRLEAVVESRNGFELAEKDLEIRGPGQIYGREQSGFFPNLKIASLTDYSLIKKARQEAIKILNQDPQLKKYPLLKNQYSQFEKSVYLE